MKHLIILLLITVQTVFAQNVFKNGDLKVSANGHYLQHTNGKPFFWLGDTAWELFHRLTLPEIEMYLDNRAAKGFNVIQAVALAEFEGLTKPNQYGDVPFYDLDPTKPNNRYFSIIDKTLTMAEKRNLYVGLLPTWGDKVTQLWGAGPVVFDTLNAYIYGKWLGNRYKSRPNIIWILGGDRPAVKDSDDWRPIWRAMAKGILEATRHKHLISFHPWGGSSSTSQWIHNEDWLDINMYQSGHGGGHDTPTWQLAKRDFDLNPTKPTLDAEINYEDHPVNPWPKWNPENGYYRDYDVRKQAYRSVFAGACGLTYGHHAVWQFMNAKEETVNYPDRGWKNALDRPGAKQMSHLKNLVDTYDFQKRIPTDDLIIEGQGEKEEHAVAFISKDKSLSMIYLPVGKAIVINKQTFGTITKASWFNPRNGNYEPINTFDNDHFVSPTIGKENDWVLILENSKF